MTSNFSQRVTQIKGLSDRRRLPRLGRIRLGLKAVTPQGKEYPKEVSYFVCPDEVKKVYGDMPTELDVMIPLNDLNAVFPCAYKHYGSGRGLKCSGDGEIAHRVNEETKEMEQTACPCKLLEDKKCKQTGTLMVMLPKVSVGGVYQISTSSINSIIDVNSGLDYVSALLGRFAMVPLKLRRIKTETHHDDKKQNHYTMQIIFDGDINTVNALRADTLRVLEHPRFQLPAPMEENPALDPIDIVADEEVPEQSPPVVASSMRVITEEDYFAQGDPEQPADVPEPDFSEGELPLAPALPPAPPKSAPPKKKRDLGAAVKCPDLPEGRQLRPKKDCDTCPKVDGCPEGPNQP